MLDDTPRKLLRVIFQFKEHYRRMPTIDELKRLSGRRPATIKVGMLELVAHHYIKWDDKQPVETAIVLEAWERDVQFKESTEAAASRPQFETRASNTRYWTDY